MSHQQGESRTWMAGVTKVQDKHGIHIIIHTMSHQQGAPALVTNVDSARVQCAPKLSTLNP